MEKEREFLNNAHPPVTLSADPPWIGFPNTNWGSSLDATFRVTLDPQVNVRRDPMGLAATERRHPSIVEVDKLMEEFVGENEDLLDELAR